MEKQRSIGIIREEKNKWERRCSITPREAKLLIEDGIKVIV
jgi:alanine dehydrogenase